jgi:hypothetical protein
LLTNDAQSGGGASWRHRRWIGGGGRERPGNEMGLGSGLFDRGEGGKWFHAAHLLLRPDRERSATEWNGISHGSGTGRHEIGGNGICE